MCEDKDLQCLPKEQVEAQEATILTHKTTPQEIPLITNRQASYVGTSTSSCSATTEKGHPSQHIVVLSGSYSDRKPGIHNINIAEVFPHEPKELELDVFKKKALGGASSKLL
uniref:Uncharacterized protein n=1 Tax=Timema bartmani TaxID=61472 RepID=A0A7R9F959_9NEOP|nr:unnamed protein product [Timema bartmani]